MSWDALAAVAVTSTAFAQSNVTISGNLNINALGNTKTTTQTAPGAESRSTKTTTTAGDNGWTASQLLISGSEDLGGGLTASFAIATGLGGGTSSFADRDRNLALSGDFGTVRFGRFVPAAAMGYHGYTGRVSTSQAGTTYGLGAAGASGATAAANINANMVFGGSFERNNNNIQYTTPNFNGFVANVNYGRNSSDRTAAANPGKNSTTQTGLGLVYAEGPLSVGFGTNNRTVNEETGTAAVCINGLTGAVSIAASCTDPTATITTDIVDFEESQIKARMDWLGASYDLGVVKLFASHMKRKDKVSAPGVPTTNFVNIKMNAFGVSMPVGAFTLAASTYRGKDKGADNVATDDTKLTGHQLNLTYDLSKRTVIYAAVGESQIKRSGGNVGATRKFTSNAVGIMHSF